MQNEDPKNEQHEMTTIEVGTAVEAILGTIGKLEAEINELRDIVVRQQRAIKLLGSAAVAHQRLIEALAPEAEPPPPEFPSTIN
jgi:hypothetical protein